jgi:hypothetical protein
LSPFSATGSRKPSFEPINVYGAPIKSNPTESTLDTELFQTNPETRDVDILIESEPAPEENGNQAETTIGPESKTIQVEESRATTTIFASTESSKPKDKTGTRKIRPTRPKALSTLYGAPNLIQDMNEFAKPVPDLYGSPEPVPHLYGAPVSKSEELPLPVYVTPKPQRKQLKIFKTL